jgi:hypothetical protein
MVLAYVIAREMFTSRVTGPGHGTVLKKEDLMDWRLHAACRDEDPSCS